MWTNLRNLRVSLLGSNVNCWALCICSVILNSLPKVVPQSVQDSIPTCDPLFATGTSVLCTPPSGSPITDCSQRSIPGTIASYACRNPDGEVLRGFLNCTDDGVWMSSLRFANNSLCNLEAAIINVQTPDIAVATSDPGFTTPKPNVNLMQQDFNTFTDYQQVALQLHNTFRRNHGVPFVSMAPLMNEAAQDMSDFIATGNSVDIESSKKLAMLNVTLNIEMNWYIQPTSANKVEAVSNAVQSWYAAGFSDYDWRNVSNNLEKSNALAFTRIIWKNTKFVGVGVTNFNGVTFVSCIYTPGRHISSTDPASEFRANVLPIVIG